MTQNLYAIVGRSGAGKDYVVNRLCEWGGFKKAISHTTRPPRSGEANTHIFVSQAEFDKLRENMVAYTNFNGYDYGTTAEVLNQSDFFIVDPAGVEYMQEHADKLNRPVVVVEIQANTKTCFTRMLQRGDGVIKAAQRIDHDSKAFAGFKPHVYFVNNKSGDQCAESILLWIAAREGLDM